MTANVVQTKQGAVRGVDSAGVMAFKGIPYASAPFGPHRFQPPQPHAFWTEEFDAQTTARPSLNPLIRLRSMR